MIHSYFLLFISIFFLYSYPTNSHLIYVVLDYVVYFCFEGRDVIIDH